MDNIFKSRKFYAAIVGLALALFGERAGIDQVQLQNAIYTLIAFIVGVGLEDARAKS
jgi:uncharacterized membrane protein